MRSKARPSDVYALYVTWIYVAYVQASQILEPFEYPIGIVAMLDDELLIFTMLGRFIL